VSKVLTETKISENRSVVKIENSLKNCEKLAPKTHERIVLNLLPQNVEFVERSRSKCELNQKVGSRPLIARLRSTEGL
jgi:hypothetical protein